MGLGSKIEIVLNADGSRPSRAAPRYKVARLPLRYVVVDTFATPSDPAACPEGDIVWPHPDTAIVSAPARDAVGVLLDLKADARAACAALNAAASGPDQEG